MKLTNTRIRSAKVADKPYKLVDGGGLCLEIRPTGSKLWRQRYRLAGKENMYAIGSYPEISLADAREERDKAKKLIKQGVHPAHHRKLERIRHTHEHANTFEAVAGEWLDQNAPHWKDKTHKQRQRILKNDIFPLIGTLPVRQVIPAHVLNIVKRVEKRAPSMAVLANQIIGAICRYAVATLRADTDPTNPLRGSLKSPPVQHCRPLAISEIPDFIAALESYSGYVSNKIALHLMLLTLARTSEVVGAKWSEINFEQAIWTIPAERMKMGEIHTVPLPRQAIDWLKRLQGVTGTSACLFPSRSNHHMPASKGVLWKAVASMGYQGHFSPHGIRATGSTLLNEMGYRPEVIEHQLAHKERNKTRASYNRAEYLKERRKMMQDWADYLDNLKAGSEIIPIHQRA